MERFTVLIIDDDEVSHQVLGEYLELAGFGVLHARDGAAGVQVMEELSPDLSLLDVNMPVMDGFRTMEVISRDSKLRDIPVLFLSSLDRYNLKVKGLELGAEDYVVKPYNKAELLARINAALRRSGRYRRNEAAMQGNLADISLAELLQTLDIGRKTACVQLDELAGYVCVDRGNIVSAAYREFSGAEAVGRLFFLEKGRFSISFDERSERLNGQLLPVQKTLFETIAYMDELREMVRRISEVNCMVEALSADTSELGPVSGMLPLMLNDLIALMKADLKDNVSVISAMISKGDLALIKQ